MALLHYTNLMGCAIDFGVIFIQLRFIGLGPYAFPVLSKNRCHDSEQVK